jgi:hypothetical protein
MMSTQRLDMCPDAIIPLTRGAYGIGDSDWQLNYGSAGCIRS